MKDEIPWYLPRFGTSWGWVGAALIVFQFLVPFLLLLSRPLKQNARAITAVVLLLLFMRLVDLFWIVAPNFSASGFRIHWMNVTVPAAIGGLWVAFFLWQLSRRPLLPLGAPNLEQALTHGEE